MAFRINTVEYGWETLNSEISGSTPALGATKQIYIPETGSRTFLDVDLEVFVRDANTGTTISNITSYQLSCSIDGNITGQTSVNTITMTGDHVILGFKDNFTNLFNARFTGSVHSVQPSLNFPHANAGRWNGHSFRLTATYQYSDTDVDSVIKTVRLPLDSSFGSLGTTAMTVFGKRTAGYLNIPAFDTFLPESSKKIRDLWIEYHGVDASQAATSVNMVTQIDSGSQNTRFTLRSAMTSDTSYIDFQNISGSIDTSIGHTLSASASLASRLNSISPIIKCTYEYSRLSSTKILSSCIFPLNSDYYSDYNGNYGTTNGFVDFLVPDRDPFLLNSAFICSSFLRAISTNKNYFVNDTLILNTFPLARGNPPSGHATTHARFDSEASSSANFSIQPGYNKLKFKTTGATTLNHFTSFNPILILNYSSSKLVDIYNHNQVIYLSTGSFKNTTSVGTFTFNTRPTASFNPQISQSYYMHDVVGVWQANQSTAVLNPIIKSFNFPSGSKHFAVNSTHAIIEQGLKIIPYGINAFIKYPNEPTSSVKLDYFGGSNGEQYFTYSTINEYNSFYSTFQQNIFRITGSLTNCSQAGVNYQVDILLSGSNVPPDPIYVLSTSGSGTTKWFTFDWYEDINKVYAVSTYPEYKVSNQITASNSNGVLTIDFATSAGGEKSFTFIG